MAELVGFTSSVLGIAAVATCLVETVLKIQALCREVKNAPKELTLVVNEIHHSGTVLKAVAESYAVQSKISRVHMRGGLLKESMSLCQNALTSISSLAIAQTQMYLLPSGTYRGEQHPRRVATISIE